MPLVRCAPSGSVQDRGRCHVDISRLKTRHCRILIVEDNTTLRTLTVSLLEAAGYSCDSAGTVLDATDRIRGNTYDLVITDFDLSDGTALNLLDRVTDDGTCPRIAVLSAAARAQLKGAREHPRVVAVWAKPMRREALLQNIAGLVAIPTTKC